MDVYGERWGDRRIWLSGARPGGEQGRKPPYRNYSQKRQSTCLENINNALHC